MLSHFGELFADLNKLHVWKNRCSGNNVNEVVGLMEGLFYVRKYEEV